MNKKVLLGILEFCIAFVLLYTLIIFADYCNTHAEVQKIEIQEETMKEKMESAFENITYCETTNKGTVVIDKEGNEYIIDTAVVTKSETETESKVCIFYTDTKEESDKMFDFIQTKGNEIVIEISTGTVIDKETGDGESDSGYYIHYGENKYEKGTRIQSVFVYNPDSNYTDDILYRVDTVIKEGTNNDR